MKVADGRGMHMKKTEKKNREKVKRWFDKNPGKTISECSKALKLSVRTIRKHTTDLRRE